MIEFESGSYVVVGDVVRDGEWQGGSIEDGLRGLELTDGDREVIVFPNGKVHRRYIIDPVLIPAAVLSKRPNGEDLIRQWGASDYAISKSGEIIPFGEQYRVRALFRTIPKP